MFSFLLTYPFMVVIRSYNFDDLTDQTIIQEDNAIMSFTIDQVNIFYILFNNILVLIKANFWIFTRADKSNPNRKRINPPNLWIRIPTQFADFNYLFCNLMNERVVKLYISRQNLLKKWQT